MRLRVADAQQLIIISGCATPWSPAFVLSPPLLFVHGAVAAQPQPVTTIHVLAAGPGNMKCAAAGPAGCTRATRARTKLELHCCTFFHDSPLSMRQQQTRTPPRFGRPALLLLLAASLAGAWINWQLSNAWRAQHHSATLPAAPQQQRRLLSFRVAGGLTNQRIYLKGGLLLGLASNRTVVLPAHAYSRAAFLSDPAAPAAGWQAVPLGIVYDTHAIARCCLQRLGLHVVDAESTAGEPRLLPPPLVLPGPAQHVVAQLPSLKHELHVALREPPTMYRPEPHTAEAVDSCIAFSGAVCAAASAVAAAARRLAGGGRLLGVHLRLEDDGLRFFGRGDGTGWAARQLNASITCLAAALANATEPPAGARPAVYVASGLPLSAPRLAPLHSALPVRMLQKGGGGPLSPPALDALARYGADVGAAVDQLVLGSDDVEFFVGAAQSSFSIQVARERRRRRLPSSLNGPCGGGDGEMYPDCLTPLCSLFQGFDWFR